MVDKYWVAVADVKHIVVIEGVKSSVREWGMEVWSLRITTLKNRDWICGVHLSRASKRSFVSRKPTIGSRLSCLPRV